MKLTYATVLIVTGIHAAPNPNAASQLQKLLSDAGSKAINAIQGYADDANVGVDVQAKADTMFQVGQDFMKAKEPEFNQWMKDQGYDQKVKKLVGEATKIRNKNKGKTPAQIVDSLNVKINSLTRENVKNAELKAQLVKLTKAMKAQAKDTLQNSGVANKKSKKLWKDAASKLEAKANEQIAAAQAA